MALGMPPRHLSRSLLAFAALLLLAAAPASARHHHRHHRAHRVGACSSSHAPVRHATLVRARDATLCLLNRARARHGLRPLRLNRKLGHVARMHSRDMVRRHYFDHDSRNGATPFQRILHTRYVPPNRSWWLGENIGWGGGSGDPAMLVRMWMHSPGHRANILSNRFRDIGIGIAPGTPAHGHRRGATYTTDFGAHS
jgi:uncharacterized protein YkwD